MFHDFTFQLGCNVRTVLAFMLPGILLATAAAITLIQVEPEQPKVKGWRHYAREGGKVTGLISAGLLVSGGMWLRDGLLHGDRVIIDLKGARFHTFWGRVVTATWEEGLRLETKTRYFTETIGRPPELLSLALGNVVEMVHDLTAQRAVQAKLVVWIESAKFRVKVEPDNGTVISLMRWNVCRQTLPVIRQRGGTVHWLDDGFEAVSFAGTPFSDVDMVFAAPLLSVSPQLRSLDLSRTLVTNESLPLLQTLTSLEVIKSEGTSLDRAALDAFEQAAATPRPGQFDFLAK